MDMQIGEAGDPLTAYIALTRVQDRHGLFVYRPFAAAPFQKGAKVGRELLLRFWGGEKMDWAALRTKYREEKACKECNEAKPASAFTAGRWKREDAGRVCKECIRRHTDAQVPWQCMACGSWKEAEAFAARHARPQCTFYRVCRTCEETRLCNGCNARKGKNNFSVGGWKQARDGARLCLECCRKARGRWTCSRCKARETGGMFQKWKLQHGSLRGDQLCDNCMARPLARSLIRRAVVRVAATEAKVTQQRKARAIASVWEAIAERKRQREGNGSEADPSASQKRRKADEGMVVSERRAKAGHAPLPRSGKAMPATEPGSEAAVAEEEQKRWQYICPYCNESVTSFVRSGQVDHRRSCGNFFRVKEGRVIAKASVYVCPFCKGKVQSKIQTGQIDHRGACGNRFAVQAGQISPRTRQHGHSCPLCQTLVWSPHLSGRIRSVHDTPEGKRCQKTEWTVAEPKKRKKH